MEKKLITRRRHPKLIALGFVDSRWFYRLLEIFPGFITWLIILAPFYLSFRGPVLLAYFIIAFDIYWFLKSVRMSTSLVMAYNRYKQAKTINWAKRMNELNNVTATLKQKQQEFISLPKPSWYTILNMNAYNQERRRHYRELKGYIAYLQNLEKHPALLLKPKDIFQLVIMPCFRVDPAIVTSTIQAVIDSHFESKQVVFILAYEERGGEESERFAQELAIKYKSTFAHFEIVKHPDGVVGELRGKGANISWAGHASVAVIEKFGLDPNNVIVTTLDEDNIVDPNYFAYTTCCYTTDPNRLHRSFQPIAMYLNNIWDASAPMRVIASGNSFWNMIEMTRPHRLRNFASHAQGLQTLIDTDFWSVTTVVEDGHQYWRTYYTYDGDHRVVPMYVPIYQDAIQATTYRRSFRNQFKQLNRWAWGVSDFPYAVKQNLKNSRIPWGDKWLQVGRLLEGHISWATAPLILAYYAWLPLILNANFKNLVLAHQLPVIASRVLTFASVGIFATIWVSLLLLPPRPAHHRRARLLSMILQWSLLPITTIAFGALAALDAQTRLMFGRYPKEFAVTEKVARR